MQSQSDPKNRQDNKAHHEPRLDEDSESKCDDDKYARDEECAYSRKSPVIHFDPLLIFRSSSQIRMSMVYMLSH